MRARWSLLSRARLAQGGGGGVQGSMGDKYPCMPGGALFVTDSCGNNTVTLSLSDAISALAKEFIVSSWFG